jgi:hypothetical protein
MRRDLAEGRGARKGHLKTGWSKPFEKRFQKMPNFIKMSFEDSIKTCV